MTRTWAVKFLVLTWLTISAKKDLTGNKRDLRRLRMAFESVKRTLRSSRQANIEKDSLFEGVVFYMSTALARLEELCSDLFSGISRQVEKSLRDAKMDKSLSSSLSSTSRRVHGMMFRVRAIRRAMTFLTSS